MTTGHEVALTNSRGWATVPPPPQPKTVISLPNDRRIISIPGGGLETSVRSIVDHESNHTWFWAGSNGFTGLGRGGTTSRHADDPVGPNSSPVITPQAQEERYLLLVNGQLVQGVITENESEFLVEQRMGVMRFAKKRVEGAFSSIREAYEYRLAQRPTETSTKE